VTTRPARPGETDGADYVFIDRARFDAMVAAGELLEHAVVFGHCYGTPRRPIDDAIAAGRDVVADVDWQGTQQLTENLRGDLVTVFILPPDMATLEARLKTRAQDSAAVVAARMAKSAEEMSPGRNTITSSSATASPPASPVEAPSPPSPRRTRQNGLAIVNRTPRRLAPNIVGPRLAGGDRGRYGIDRSFDHDGSADRTEQACRASREQMIVGTSAVPQLGGGFSRQRR
jgi:hypothetical protein